MNQKNKHNLTFFMNMKWFVLVVLISSAFICNGQDTLRALNAEQVLQIVKKYHPIVKQSQLQIDNAQANLLNARGSFDPIINTYISRKTFGGKEYYNQITPEIEIPTWYGIELYTGIQNLTGAKLDPSETSGQSNYVGISIPLAKDLIFDKRRAQLRQAQIFKSLASVEQQKMINDLLMESMEAYWNWVKAYQSYQIVSANVEVTKKRTDLIVRSYVNGERAAIDTVEAMTQLQSFLYQQAQAKLAFQNAGLQLSSFLWTENETALILTDFVIPDTTWDNNEIFAKFNIVLDDLLNAADKNHPTLKSYDYKIDALLVEKRLKFQELLPKIDFRYNQLSKGFNPINSLISGPVFENSFQYGIKFQMPLSFSSGRANYKMAKIKIENTSLEQVQKRLAIQLKIKSYFNEFIYLKNQIELQTNNYQYNLQLVKAEEYRYFNGESSLFLVNARENKSLEALEKLIDLKTKYYKTIYALQWSAGLLF